MRLRWARVWARTARTLAIGEPGGIWNPHYTVRRSPVKIVGNDLGRKVISVRVGIYSLRRWLMRRKEIMGTGILLWAVLLLTATPSPVFAQLERVDVESYTI